jgi:hypothetical protein
MAILHFRCKERRRTVRVMLRIPLKVHGISSEGETFAVETMTHTISLHGASVELEYPVELGDILTVENELTRQQVEGKVVTLRKTREGKVHVGCQLLAYGVSGAGSEAVATWGGKSAGCGGGQGRAASGSGWLSCFEARSLLAGGGNFE